MPEPKDIEFWDEVEKFISDRSLGIINLDGAKHRTIGTATLIQNGNIVGLLTCGHVVEQVTKLSKVGLVRFNLKEGHGERIVLIKDEISPIVSPGLNHKIDGTDLGFISIPKHRFASLAAKMSPVDWQTQRSRAHSTPPPETQRSSFIMGMLGEWEPEEPVILSNNIIKYDHRGLINAGRVDHEEKNEMGLDLIDFSIDNGPVFQGPKNYGGTSGAAVWSFYWRELESKKIEVVERRLLGLAFFAIYEPTTRIRCHGPHSVHEYLFNIVNKKFA